MAQPTEVSPKFNVLLNGKLVNNKVKDDITGITLSDYLEGSASFAITLNIWDADKQEYKWIDEKTFKPGDRIQIKLGYSEEVEPLLEGEVTGFEPMFADATSPVMEIRGYDKLHRFQRGRKTRTFTKMTDSQIAKKIAGEFGLKSQVDDTKIKHEYLCQRNQSNIDFLKHRARRIGFELNIEEGKLRFRDRANEKKEVMELRYGRELRSFFPRLTTVGQISEFEVKGWDPLTKKPISVKTTRVSGKMGGKTTGVAQAKKAFRASPDVVTDLPVFSVQEAKQIAGGMYEDLALDFITGEATAVGDTAIRAGEVIKLAKLGKTFSGLYYITSSTHSIDRGGYVTTFKVQRNAS